MIIRTLIWSMPAVFMSILVPNAATCDEYALNTSSDVPVYATTYEGDIDKDSIPMVEAMWGLFLMVVNVEDSMAGGGKDILIHNIRLSEENADTLFRYIRAAVDEDGSQSRDQFYQFCDKRQETKITRSELAAELSEMDRLSEMRRARLVSEISLVLDPNVVQMVIDWVDHNIRPKLQITRFDYASYLNIAQVDPSSAAQSACQGRAIIR